MRSAIRIIANDVAPVDASALQLFHLLGVWFRRFQVVWRRKASDRIYVSRNREVIELELCCGSSMEDTVFCRSMQIYLCKIYGSALKDRIPTSMKTKLKSTTFELLLKSKISIYV
ncbi:hypothetical protein CEXT_365751 [Caerostris extrusa]|uniref:Uncharacterized protein n=1 Tax=Caerostris extrusa TaxID=172846 RepID=A0AAV4WYK7_CAEEX|nr:hypothetical protein CEXT_365751 [Caerostris extrusa]